VISEFEDFITWLLDVNFYKTIPDKTKAKPLAEPESFPGSDFIPENIPR
jgi:hypothetical protein